MKVRNSQASKMFLSFSLFGSAALHRIEVQFDRYVGDDGGEKFGVANVFHVVAHFFVATSL